MTKRSAEDALKVVEKLLMTRYGWTHKKTIQFIERTRTMLDGKDLYKKKPSKDKKVTPAKRLVRTAVLQPAAMPPAQQKELEARAKKLEEELRKKGLLMDQTNPSKITVKEPEAK